MKLPIRHYGDPVLRKKGELVEAITDETRTLVGNLIDTLQAIGGDGLAAPQIGVSLAVFIIAPHYKNSENQWEQEPPQPFINPKLKNPSTQTWIHSEGCLSVPKLYGDVVRPTTITVTWLDLEGVEHTETFSGWKARVIMHENDHINGVLFVDRISPEQRREFEPRLRQIKRSK
jgi:peptide deformylase